MRHPHLQPYLAQYTNLSPVFLPVRSKSPKIELPEKQNKPSRAEQRKQSDTIPKMEEKNANAPSKKVTDSSSSSESSTLSDQPAENLNMERITALVRWNISEKSGGRGLGEEKAEAMESLLELCAQLLKRERFEELAGVLRPFGEEEAVSSRETAIWLTKGLMNIQRRNEQV